MKIKILSYSDTPDFISDLGFLKYLRSILLHLKKFSPIQEIWIVEKNNPDLFFDKQQMSIHNLYSFNNGYDILKKFKPDLLLINSSEYVSLSLIYAAKKLNIPSVFIGSGQPTHHTASDVSYTFFKRLNQMKLVFIPFLKKYFFLIKTLFKIKTSPFQIFNIIINHFLFLSRSVEPINVVKYVDLCIGSNEYWKIFFEKNKVDSNKISIVGEYALDNVFLKLNNLSKHVNKNFEILFITTAVTEHGLWTRKTHRELIISTVSQINKIKPKVNLKFKIHPTGENISYYRQVIDSIDDSIQIFQKEDLLELVNSSDLIISYARSNSLLIPLILKKPIIILNSMKEKYDFIDFGIVVECQNVKDLNDIINQKKWNKLKSKKIDDVIEKLVGKFDGKCSYRASLEIFNLLKNFNR